MLSLMHAAVDSHGGVFAYSERKCPDDGIFDLNYYFFMGVCY